MNNKIEYQILFDVKENMKMASRSLDEFTKAVESVTGVCKKMEDVAISCFESLSNYAKLFQRYSNDFQFFSESTDSTSKKMQEFQNELKQLKLKFIDITGDSAKFFSLFNEYIPIMTFFAKGLKRMSSSFNLVSTAQNAYNGVIIWGQRALYIYQMQVLLARAAIATTTGATKAMNIAIAASPYLIAAAAAATLGIAIYKLALGNSETAKAQKRLDEAMTDMNKEVSTEQNSLDTLFGSLYKAKEGTNEWKRAKDKIQEKYGDYLSQLGIEITNVDTARVAYSKLSTAILETARARASERALSSAGDALADKEGQNLTKMRQVLTEEYGEETGNRVFEGIAASIRRGDKEIPERWMQFVRKLNKTVVQSYGTAGQASSYIDNPVTPYIYSMQSARKDYEKEVKRINAVLGSPLQKPDTNTITEKPKSVFSSESDTPAKGSIAAMKKELSELEKSLSNTTVGTASIDIQLKIDSLKKQIAGAEDWIERETFKKEYGEISIPIDFTPVGGSISGMVERLQNDSIKDNPGMRSSMLTQEGFKDMKLPEPEVPNMEKPLSNMERWNMAVDEMGERNANMIDGLGSMGTAMGSIGDLIGGAAGQWLDWGANCVQAIGAAIPQILALCTVQGTQVAANTAVAGTGAASAMASIPFVGPILAIAAVASVLAALASIPKFAAGGLAYGPTLGLFGEYSGAQNNPEVVAPLNRLRNMLQPAGGIGGEVEFVIDGRVLRGILNKVDRINQRTK
ncbi:hypothetical protein [Bacteroides nordii]|uniref:hypothetical protein n=1 Tax=Bacteroides nordii TaxID=291645 RepID=UPI002A84159F|nr:hypothetical protein [Bacteroides nordii]